MVWFYWWKLCNSNKCAYSPSILFENFETLDASLFLDIANIWGVDYDSSIDDDDEIKFNGIGLDWFTAIGPINFLYLKLFLRRIQTLQNRLDLI